MSFNYSKITHDDAVKLGSDDAPLKVIEYINLRCPDSKNYEDNLNYKIETDNLIDHRQSSIAIDKFK